MRFFEFQTKRRYPGALISHLYMMMGMHLLVGTQEFLDLIRFMNEEIADCPVFEGKKILWLHLIPFYQETLKKYFDRNEDYQIIASDIILDYMEEMDAEHPFEALAKKIIRNLYNGSYAYKADAIASLCDRLHPDAVIYFCHWGCKQASGGSILLKEKMQEKQIPTLILDGDGIDKRNSHDGQIKTRLEAFLEMLDEKKNAAAERTEGGSVMLGYICKYAPIEVFESMGVEMKRIDPQVTNFTQADMKMHPNICSFAKGVLEDVMAGGYEGVILTTCCDSIRRLYDVLKQELPDRFIYILDTPRITKDAGIALYEGRIRKMIEAYEAFSGKTFEEEKLADILRKKKKEQSISLGESGCGEDAASEAGHRRAVDFSQKEYRASSEPGPMRALCRFCRRKTPIWPLT